MPKRVGYGKGTLPLRPWVASKDNPSKLPIERVRKLDGTSNKELMDNANILFNVKPNGDWLS